MERTSIGSRLFIYVKIVNMSIAKKIEKIMALNSAMLLLDCKAIQITFS